MVSAVLMMMNVDTLVCVIQMLIAPILMDHTNAHVQRDLLVMVNSAVTLMNVLLVLVMQMHYVLMFQVASCVNVIKDSPVMDLHVLMMTNVPTLHVLHSDNVPIFLVISHVHVTKDTLVMDIHAHQPKNAPNVTHVTPMQNVTDGDVRPSAHATKDTKETARSVMMLTNAEPEKPVAPHSLPVQIFLVLTDVNVNLDLLVMDITVSMSMNVLTILVERMHHAQTPPVHTDAHVTEATKVKICYVMCYVTLSLSEHLPVMSISEIFLRWSKNYT